MAEAQEEVLLQREDGAGVVQEGGAPALKKRRVDTTATDDVDVDVDVDVVNDIEVNCSQSQSTTASSHEGVAVVAEERQENEEVPPVLELRRCPTERTNGIFPADILLTGLRLSLNRHLKKRSLISFSTGCSGGTFERSRPASLQTGVSLVELDVSGQLCVEISVSKDVWSDTIRTDRGLFFSIGQLSSRLVVCPVVCRWRSSSPNKRIYSQSRGSMSSLEPPVAWCSASKEMQKK